MLNVESGPDNILYRIQRVSGNTKRIVYVRVNNADIIPEDDRTYGPAAIAHLCKLKEWSDSWMTLDVNGDQGETWCEADTSPPPAVPKKYLLDQYPVCDISSLSVIREAKSRVSEVSRNGQAFFLKIARFPREISWVIQEIQAYHALAGSSLVPRMISYVSEPTPDRIIGFLVEKLDGRTAELDDLEPCARALDQLHEYVIHGDLCKYNIFITPQGPKFIDLEHAILAGTDRWSVVLRDEEKQVLAAKLADTSGAGRPW